MSSTTKPKKPSKKNDEFKEMLKKACVETTAKINNLKRRFDQADTETKSKIIAGLSVVAAGLVVLAGLKRSRKRK